MLTHEALGAFAVRGYEMEIKNDYSGTLLGASPSDKSKGTSLLNLLASLVHKYTY